MKLLYHSIYAPSSFIFSPFLFYRMLILIRCHSEFFMKSHNKVRAIGKTAAITRLLNALPREQELFRLGKTLGVDIIRRRGLEMLFKLTAKRAFRYVKHIADIVDRTARIAKMRGYVLDYLNKLRRQGLRLSHFATVCAYCIKYSEKAGQRTELQLLGFVKAGKKIKAKLNKFFLVIL